MMYVAFLFCFSFSFKFTFHRQQPFYSFVRKGANGFLSDRNDSPFLRSLDSISDSIIYKNDLVTFMGAENYKMIKSSWCNYTIPELSYSKFSVTSIQILDKKIIMSWNVSFVAESNVPLVILCDSFNIKIRFFDTLNKISVQSSFSWDALFKTLRWVR